MITSIKFDEKVFEGYSMVRDENFNNLNKINVFIGKNNSGKSRFLRLLLKNKFDVETTKFNSNILNDDIERFRKNASYYLGPLLSSPTFSHLNQAIYELPKLSYVRYQDSISHLKALLENLFNSLTSTASLENKITVQNIVSASRSRIQHYLGQFKEDSLDYSKIYIPTLRGLRPLQIISSGNKEDFVLSENNYLKRSEVDYKLKASIDIHTGLDLYQTVESLILGDDEEKIKLRNFERYLSETFFQRDIVELIPRKGKDVLYIRIGDDKQRAIYDLGDGIQAIILLTYPLFFNEGKEILFFIEEPELHLHPGLERVLVETMRDERFNTFQYFITTHSNHILDLTLEYDDISVYSFQKKTTEKENTFLIQNVSSEHKQVLDLLGVRNSSVFLANCTIWVEGITDRLYLRKYIDLLQKEKGTTYKEDYHYAFIEYAGSNITHWSFLESEDKEFANINIDGICSKVFLIVDNDGVELPDGKKRKN